MSEKGKKGKRTTPSMTGSEGPWRMKTARIMVSDYEDFVRQAGLLAEANPGAIGLTEDHLPNIWRMALQFQRPAANGIAVNVFYYVP